MGHDFPDSSKMVIYCHKFFMKSAYVISFEKTDMLKIRVSIYGEVFLGVLGRTSNTTEILRKIPLLPGSAIFLEVRNGLDIVASRRYLLLPDMNT